MTPIMPQVGGKSLKIPRGVLLSFTVQHLSCGIARDQS
jgi:hypothetical protein